ncbi:MAG: hypothetical protein CMI54_03065 [Parcubacteria group bacterium]|nr:hypothetical protein [Parcubacteria group bacterium]|tara:strand:+ start:347 stop:664 length:318 start_codon:yes stop_codon:yes gene_type:complete
MKKNKGYFRVKKYLMKDAIHVEVKSDMANKKVFHVDDGGRNFYGTADTIVFNMRFWDTAAGRCDTNSEYMKIVSGRITNFPVCDDEILFLDELKTTGLIDISESN